MPAPASFDDSHIPVAAAVHLRAVLTGPVRTAKVLTSGRLAAYVRVETAEAGTDGGRPGMLAVVAPGAAVPAGSLVLPEGVAPDAVLPAGRQVVIGGGRLVVDGPSGADTAPGVGHGPHAHQVVLRVARWLVASRVAAGDPSAPAARALAGRLAELPTPPVEVGRARSGASAAARALAGGRLEEATALLSARLGLGPGATPSGDDVAAGVLLAARADPATFSPGDVCDVADRVADLASVRTTAVSAALLADAAAGWCAEPVDRALRALAPAGRPRPPTQLMPTRARELDDALDGLLALGHHSGADLATGLLAALTAGGAQPNDEVHHDQEERA